MDNSPLHLAAANGYTRSMKMLLTVYPNLLDCSNKDKVRCQNVLVYTKFILVRL